MAKYSFTSAKEKAKNIAQDPQKVKQLMTTAMNKLKSLDSDSDKIGKLIDRIQTFVRMIRAYIKGEYKEIPWKSVVLIIASLLYFVNPLDLIPDFIPITGFLDDISIVLWVFSSLEKDIEAFKQWERQAYSEK